MKNIRGVKNGGKAVAEIKMYINLHVFMNYEDGVTQFGGVLDVRGEKLGSIPAHLFFLFFFSHFYSCFTGYFLTYTSYDDPIASAFH
jgi:hypothetical protein